MTLEQETLAFLSSLAKLYFERRDMGAVVEAMGEETSWIGTGEGELCCGLEQAKILLAGELGEYPGNFTVTDQRFETLPVGEDVCVAYGVLRARAEDPETADLSDRVTAVCARTPGGMRLLHLHLSHADRGQGAGEFYLRTESLRAQELLRAQVDQATRELKARNRELQALTDNLPCGVNQCLRDEELTLVEMSDSFLELFGCTGDEVRRLYHNKFLRMIYPDDRAAVAAALQEQLKRGPVVDMEYRVVRKDGQVLWVMDRGRLARREDGTEYFYCILMDITQRRRQQEELRLSLERHQVIMDQATDIIFEWDIRRDTLTFSPNWRKKFGYTAIESQISARIPGSINIHPQDMASFVKIMRDTAAGVPYSETEFRIRDIMKNYIWCRIRATTQYDENGRPIRAVGVIADIDADKKQRQQLIEQAERDSLTGLLNKAATQRRVERLLSGLDSGAAMFVIDLDNFKAVNDRCGHLCGDAVLTETAATIRRHLRDSDVVGRIGGDEFLAFLPEMPRETAAGKAREILEALRRAEVRDGPSGVSCSIGVAFAPWDAASFFQLYRCADHALYQAKSGGRGEVALYSPRESALEYGEALQSGTTIDSEVGSVAGRLAQYSFRTLYGAADVEATIRQLLEIVGKTYDLSRVYIVERPGGGRGCGVTFQWCNDGVPWERPRACGEDLGGYLKNFDAEGVLHCRDTAELAPELRRVLVSPDVCSLLQCAIKDEGQFGGFVGFDECKSARRWTAEQVHSLVLTANVIATFLVKHRYKQKITPLPRES